MNKSDYIYNGESIHAPVWKKIAENMNEQLKLGLIKIIYDENNNIIELKVVDEIGLAIWYNNKFNKIKWEEYKDEFKEEKTD